jgi:hypothetical protein
MKLLKYITGVNLGLLVWIMIQGLFTYGASFKFETYSIIGWITQGLGTLFTITFSVLLTEEVIKDKEK